jgi:hypothetical protein
LSRPSILRCLNSSRFSGTTTISFSFVTVEVDETVDASSSVAVPLGIRDDFSFTIRLSFSSAD